MKKLILLSAALSLALASSPLEIGQKLYENGEYKKAYDVLKGHKDKYYSNARFNFIFGKSAYFTKDYETFLSANETILIFDPTNQKALYHLALAKMKLQDYQGAKKIFLDLLSNTQDEKMINFINKHIEALSQTSTPNTFKDNFHDNLGQKSSAFLEKTKPNPHEKDDVFKKGLSLYKKGNYNEAFTILNKHKRSYFQNEEYNYFLAKSAYLIGNYKVSLSANERILSQNPNNQYARYNLVLAQIELKMFEDAKNELKYLFEMQDLDPNLKPLVIQKLNIVNKFFKKSSIKVQAGVGIFYNQNVNQGIDSSFIQTPIGELRLDEKQDDFYHEELFSATHEYKLGRSDFKLVNQIVGVNDGFFKQKQENMAFLTYIPSLDYSNGKYGFSLKGQAARLFKHSRSHINLYAINPTANFLLTSSTKLNIGANLLLNRYLKDQKHSDSNVYGAQIGLEQYFSKMGLSLDFDIGKEQRPNDAYALNYDYYDASFGIFVPFHDKMALNFLNDFRFKYYKGEDLVIYDSKRKDFTYNIDLSLFYFINDFTLKLFASYKINESNQNVYDYDQQMYGISCLYNFEF